MQSKENNTIPVILWFKNDLRIHDNEALSQAYNSGYSVLPVYIIDERIFEKELFHFKKADVLRYTFLLQTLSDLKRSFQDRGGDLLVLKGNPEKLLARLVADHDARGIYCEQEYAQEEIDTVKSVNHAVSPHCQIYEYWGKTLYHIDDIPYKIDKIPLTSKAYRINTTKNTEVRSLIEEPESWNHFEFDTTSFDIEKELQSHEKITPYLQGGERLALDRLNYYTTESELLTSYKWTRNRSMGIDYSSKLSPYLALGAISPRKIYFKVKDYEHEVKKNISTWWLVFEVVWRDYFTFKGMRMGNTIFQTEGYSKKDREFTNNKKWFRAWCDGQTGIPFIDAHMRQLNKTGYMSNRGRVNCASYLVHDLKVDWTWGAAYFESKLIDYDVSSNWMNWHNQAYEIWYTNPVNQSLKYKAYEYINQWNPELREIENEMIYIPWKLPNPPAAYAAPLVTYDKWNRAIKKISEAAQASLFKS